MEVQIFKALDHLYCEPENPLYEDILSEGDEWHSKGDVIGYRMLNLIKVCNQFSFITAIPDPNRSYTHLAFGKYPVKSFLLQPVGKIHIK